MRRGIFAAFLVIGAFFLVGCGQTLEEECAARADSGTIPHYMEEDCARISASGGGPVEGPVDSEEGFSFEGLVWLLKIMGKIAIGMVIFLFVLCIYWAYASR